MDGWKEGMVGVRRCLEISNDLYLKNRCSWLRPTSS